MTKEQYEQLMQHKQVIELFARSGEYVGGYAPFYIHDQITGEKTDMSCPNCKAATLITIVQLIKQYESSM